VWAGERQGGSAPDRAESTADDAADNVEQLVNVTADVQRAHPDLTVEQAGEASLNAGI